MNSYSKINPESKSREIRISIGRVTLEGRLVLPQDTSSIVIFSHGSGSSRFSPRNNFVADVLNSQATGTLLTDLLTPAEEIIPENRFDIELLTERLIQVTKWVRSLPGFERMRFGYFGASTGAASALRAAAFSSNEIDAIVSRGGRPDLAVDALGLVEAPTLLIVGGNDTEVIRLNRFAFERLRCTKKIEIIPGATHLFEEPGKLEEVAKLAVNWFKKHLL
jgi:dienelactone hydrolase